MGYFGTKNFSNKCLKFILSGFIFEDIIFQIVQYCDEVFAAGHSRDYQHSKCTILNTTQLALVNAFPYTIIHTKISPARYH